MKSPQLTPAEIKLVQKSLRENKQSSKIHDHSFSGKHIKFGYYSDPHVGEAHFHEDLWHAMCKTFVKEGIKNVYCPGDNVEGMSGRPGHIYDLTHIGASAQLQYASDLFASAPRLKFYIIDGN